LMLEHYVNMGVLSSTVTITNNNFRLSQGANGVVLADLGTPSTVNAVVSNNVFQTNTSCGCYNPNVPVIGIYSPLKSLAISLNRITSSPAGVGPGIYVYGGPAVLSGNIITGTYTGVWIDYANYTLVSGNLIRNSAEYGIAVTDGSSYNVIAWNVVKHSGVYDLYWDGTGTNNVWIGNHCKTSSPSGLC